MAEKNFWQDNSKTKFLVFIILSILVGLFLISWTAENLINIKEELKKVDYSVNISGDGKVIAVPDVAEVDVSVVSEAATTVKAATDNTDKVNKITALIKSKGIDDKDIKTINYNLSPKYQYTKGTSEIVGYTQSQTLLVKIRKFEIVGDVIKSAVDAGANQVGDLVFSIDNPETYKAQARAKAVEDAKEKAKSLADAAGIRLGRIINIVEGAVYTPQPQNYYLEKAYGMGGGGVPTPSIEQGSQEVSVSVTVTFALK